MESLETASDFIDQPVRLVFQTTHIDKAGETSAVRIVDTEAVGVDPATGTALLVSRDGLHFRFPAEALEDPRSESDPWIGGEELVRDFHNAITPVSLRRLEGDALQEALERGRT